MLGGALRSVFWVSIAVTCVLSAEITARVEDRLRLGVGLLAVPDHDRDLILHDELGIRGRPDGRFKKWRLNSYGFRGPEITLAPPPGCVRVMVLGASETFGLYESPDHEFPAQLRTLLNEHGCFEVLNGAVPGMTLRTLITYWNNWGRRFSPAIVAVYPTPAFYLAKNPPDYPQPPSGPPAPAPPWWTPRLIERARDVFDFPAFIQRRRVARWLADAPPPPGGVFPFAPADRLDQFEADLTILTRSIDATSARVVLLTHATAFQFPVSAADNDQLNAWHLMVPKATAPVLLEFERRSADATKRVAAAQGAALVDVAASLDGHREYFADDFIHFNDRGAQEVARAITAQVLADPAARRQR
ncbi:MAG TPA: hypothetical protein VJN96_14555 [Vicinamibacterales bacterium]|nr:hypothetical protein [Vicinamibacterales bacterium]